jgi:hypothetical protein
MSQSNNILAIEERKDNKKDNKNEKYDRKKESWADYMDRVDPLKEEEEFPIKPLGIWRSKGNKI